MRTSGFTRLALAAAIVAAFASGAASAAATIVTTCQFTGQVSTGSGTYGLNTGGSTTPSVCAQFGPAGDIAVTTVRLDSAGTYSGTVCVTGRWDSPSGDTTITPIAVVGNGVFSLLGGMAYSVDFVAGSGTLRGTYAGGAGVIDGYVNAGPALASVPCSVQFPVSGGFVAIGP